MANGVPPRRPAEDGFVPASSELLRRARAGDSRALSTLVRRQGIALTRWARGRLPRWARHFADTADLVQDALLNTFRRIDRFDDRGTGALQAYLRQAVQNRISDELRRVERRPRAGIDDDFPADALSPYDLTLSAERALRYKQALASLSEADRILIVARFEMDYTFEQLALVGDRASPEAARKALRRAVLKLAERMSDA
jgi:RNA polymerase sigma factor (sigma-70 family)